MAKTTPLQPSKFDPLSEHQRLNLSTFISDKKFFASKDDQEKAADMYQRMMKKEKELKLKGQIHIQQMPDKFGLQEFDSQTGDNVLVAALKKNFDKGIVNKAAWDYITLKRSVDELEKNKKAPGNPQPKDSNGNPNKPPAGKQGQGQEQGASSGEPQEGSEESRMEVDEIFGFEEEMEDFRKSIILSLIWMNHDYFDQKILAKAQAEYRFYKSLEREWKTQKKEEIKDGTVDQFKKLPKNRPIYAVIYTILEQARKTEHATAAAGEYVKLRTMEQKVPTKQFPKEIELEERDTVILFQKMAERYRIPSSRSFRQAAEFKMVPLDEYRQLRGTIEHQRNQISELSSRLSGITSQQIADGEIFTDIGDQNKPRRLGQRFAELFEETWSNAYEVLKPKKPERQKEDEKEETDEKTVDLLQKIVKVIYEFSKKVAQQQVDRLVFGMTPPIVDPMDSKNKAAESAKDTSEMTVKIAKDYRKAVAPATVPILQQNVLKQELQGKILPVEIGKELKEYVNSCMNLIWYMCIQDPPMVIVWGEPGEKFNKDLFRFSGKKGTKFRLTVWPAVLYSEKGPLAAAGYAVPE